MPACSITFCRFVVSACENAQNCGVPRGTADAGDGLSRRG
jgi:hypothetical protein